MISEIKIHPINNPKGNTLAFGSFVLMDAVKINCKINKGQKGLFVGLPSRKGKGPDGNDKWYNEVFITKTEVFEEVNKKVVEAYETTVSGDNQGEPPGPTDQSAGVPW